MSQTPSSPQAKPATIQSLLQTATTHHQANRTQEAEQGYRDILQRNPTQVDALHLLGVIHYQRKQYPEAISWITQALKVAPKAGIIHYNLGLCYLESHQLDLAQESLQSAKRYAPNHYPTDFSLSKVALHRGDYEQAWHDLQTVFTHTKDWWPALELEALILEKKQQCAQAIRCYESMLIKKPNQCSVLNNYAKMLLDLNALPKAKQQLDQLLQIDPHYAPGIINLGLWHIKRNQYLEAISLYLQFLEQYPAHLLALSNLALAYRRSHQYEQAIAVSQQILALPSESKQSIHLQQKALVGLCLCYQATCQWSLLDTVITNLKACLVEPSGQALLTPFDAMILDLEPPLIEKITGQYIESLASPEQQQLPKPPPRPKYRIGYLSADFGDHPVGLLLQALLPYHDKSNFEIYMLSLTEYQDTIHRQLKIQADYWSELGALSHQDILHQVRSLELDLLIDLGGFTLNARPGLLKSRLAYRQAHWLGYPGLLGKACNDYLITNAAWTPPNMVEHESLCVLPAWFATHIEVNQPYLSRSQFHLPEDAFVFCCFQRHYRFSAAMMDAWIKILDAVPESYLWLLSGGLTINDRLRAIMTQRGIAAHRLIFAEDEKLSKRFRHCLADLWLDTWQISSGTSALLALAGQLPVLSLAGRSFHARTSAAILSMLDMPELICESSDAYIETAIQLATQPEQYTALKNKLAQHNQQSLLFKPQSFMPIFEQAITQMIEQPEPETIEL